MKQAKEVDGKKDFSSVGTKGMRKTGFILLIVSLSLLVVFGIVLAITLTDAAKGMVTPIWIGYVFVPLAIASVLMLSASIAVLNASRFGDKTKQAPKTQKPVASKGSDKSSSKGESPILGDVSILGNRAGVVLSFAIAFLVFGIYAILNILGIVRLHGEGAVKRRIMDMGITKGAEVSVRKVAPLGDPIELTVRGYELSIRKGEAALIEVA